MAPVPVPEAALRAAVTGVGSLPLTDPAAAVAFVAAHAPEVPFLPQLPARGGAEGMLGEALAGTEDLLAQSADGTAYDVRPGAWPELLARLTSGAAAAAPRPTAALGAFTDALGAGRFPRARAVKGQIAGPVTLARCLRRPGGRPGLDAALLGALATHVAELVRDLARRLAVAGRPVHVVVDEPALALAADVPAGEAALRHVLASAPAATTGLHVCGPVPAALVGRLAPGLLSWDALREPALLHAVGDRLWMAETRFAFGIVDAARPPPATAALLAAWRGTLPADVDPGAVVARSLITATCGLATRSLDAAVQSFQTAADLSRRLRALFPEV